MSAPAFTRPANPVMFTSALKDGLPFGPHHELTVWLPMLCLVDSPGDKDPAALFRWLAEKAERGEMDRFTFQALGGQPHTMKGTPCDRS